MPPGSEPRRPVSVSKSVSEPCGVTVGGEYARCVRLPEPLDNNFAGRGTDYRNLVAPRTGDDPPAIHQHAGRSAFDTKRRDDVVARRTAIDLVVDEERRPLESPR